VTLAEVKVYLDLGDSTHAAKMLGRLTHDFGNDWRLAWYGGMAALLDGEYEDAFGKFDEVLQAVPGEIAPKLALAATSELILQHWDSSDPDQWREYAEKFYRTVWRTDRGVVSAAFGLARQLAARGKLDDAIAALDEVPPTSRHYNIARMTSVLLLLTGRPVTEIEESDLHQAAIRVKALPSDEGRSLQMRTLVLGAALEWLRVGNEPKSSGTTLLGSPFTDRGLRCGTEAGLRSLARGAPGRTHRYALVDLANQLRPRTWR
jgi:serine/threonine-protein kinase PknG